MRQLSPYRPVTLTRKSPGPVRHLRPGPRHGRRFSETGPEWRWRVAATDGKQWRRASTGRRESFARARAISDGSGTDCELQEQLVLRELESNLSVHSVNPGELGAGWHLYIRSEHNMSRNDPEITWVKMCLTSQFMNWRHETESQDLWSHCHDLYWEWDRSPWL